jgi:hypothetical protein
VLPVRSVAELLQVLNRDEAEVALLARSELLKAYLPKGKKGLLRNELGQRLFICGDVRLADVPRVESEAGTDAVGILGRHREAQTFAMPAGDDDISYLSTPQPAESEAYAGTNGTSNSASVVNGSESGSNGAVASVERKTIAAPGVEDMFLLLSRRPVPQGPNLKTLVYVLCSRGEDTLPLLHDLAKAAGIIVKAWDTLPYGAKPGETCYQLEIDGAVPRQVIEEALRPATGKKLSIEHLGFYPETQVYG